MYIAEFLIIFIQSNCKLQSSHIIFVLFLRDHYCWQWCIRFVYFCFADWWWVS